MDNELDQILKRVADFKKAFDGLIQDKACMDSNPFIDNLSIYIGNYIPDFELIFKYHLLFETLNEVLSSAGSSSTSFIQHFKSVYDTQISESPTTITNIENMEDIAKLGSTVIVKVLDNIVNDTDSDLSLFHLSSDSSATGIESERQNTLESPSIRVLTQTQSKLVLFISNILGNTDTNNSVDELAEIYKECFDNKTNDSIQEGGDPANSTAEPVGKSILFGGKMSLFSKSPIQSNNEPESEAQEEPERQEEDNSTDTDNHVLSNTPEDADKATKCYINARRNNNLKKKLMINNVTKTTIQRDIGNTINGEISKISMSILSEKYFDNVLLKPKDPADSEKIKMIKMIKNKILHNYVFVIKEDGPDSEYGDIYSKSFTTQILQNIKLYLIQIAKFIVEKTKQTSNEGLVALLLTLLQDRAVKGFIMSIKRTEQYHIYTRELKYYKRVKTYNARKIELNTIALLTYIYHKIAINPKIKSTFGIDIERTYNYMKQLNRGLITKYFKGGLSITNMKSAMSGISALTANQVPDILPTQPEPTVSSYMDPQNDYVESVVKDYLVSITSSVKTKIYEYDFYSSVKFRLKADADELRVAILVCVLEMFKGDSFSMCLNKLLKQNEVLTGSTDNNQSGMTHDLNDNQLLTNDIIYNLFLQKLKEDLNNPINKFRVEVIGKYANLISEIQTIKILEDELAKALRNTNKVHNPTGGSNTQCRKQRCIRTKKDRKTNHNLRYTQKHNVLINGLLSNTRKKRHIHRQKTVRQPV